MTTPTARPSHTTEPLSWLQIAYEALRPFAGQTVLLTKLHEAIEAHPDARIRASMSEDGMWGIGPALRTFRAMKLLVRKGPGVWKVSRELGE